MAFPLLVFAAAKLGAIMVPINVKLKAKEMEYILQDSSPSLLITEKNYHTTIKSEITLLEKMDVFSFESVEDLIPQRSLPPRPISKHRGRRSIISHIYLWHNGKTKRSRVKPCRSDTQFNELSPNIENRQ
ncbi:AMP-binding protein [Thalassobacillus sp. C254]|uniref:AMP-binding protein n=1 Tax=Thalassobacillus sp. C254 TaxID=1225341 RepID=UPI0018DE44A9|nr:AMP-binding protein [Thalassobacillus sp. C254]